LFKHSLVILYNVKLIPSGLGKTSIIKRFERNSLIHLFTSVGERLALEIIA
jgi:hypothetical protein